MRKIVNFSAHTSYEEEIFSALPDVEYICSTAKTEQDVIAVAHDAEIILFANTVLNANVIENLSACKLMVRYGIGYDTVDTKAAKARGIYVCNAPKYGVIDVAEHTVALMFATAKRLIAMQDRIRVHNWGFTNIGQNIRMAGKTVGFLGFGSIGRAVCKRTNACDMHAIVFDPYVADTVITEYGAERVTFHDLLSRADFITCHLPLNDSTYHILDQDAFRKMKNTAILINTSRGGILCEADLADALVSGELAGVGLDVFEDESGNMDPRLLTVPNAVLTPHIAWNTPDAARSLHKEVTDNVVRYLNGQRPESIVNGL